MESCFAKASCIVTAGADARMRWLAQPISAVAAAMVRIPLATKPSLAFEVKFIAFLSLRMMQSEDQGLRIQVKSGCLNWRYRHGRYTFPRPLAIRKGPRGLSLKPSLFSGECAWMPCGRARRGGKARDGPELMQRTGYLAAIAVECHFGRGRAERWRSPSRGRHAAPQLGEEIE